jgi:signal transduction histidine kinase/ligand-binding sensor domain-containing protein
VRHPVALTVALSLFLLTWCVCASALDPSLDISQYAHTAWKVRDGFAKSGIHWIVQPPDGYLWLGTEFGLLRFDGVRAVPWQPPGGEHLPSNWITPLLVAHDGTLWIGTFKGLASWKDGKVTQYPETAGAYVLSLFEDREQTIWLGLYEASKGRLCRIRAATVECYGEGMFGNGVVAIYQDHNGILWVSTQTGLWRWAPGPQKQYTFPHGVTEANSLIEDDAGTLLLATNSGLKQFVAGKIENYLLPGIVGQFRPTRFYRSSDGSLWVGTQQGLLHVHHGRADRFGAADGLSGDFISRIFEDREGNVWVATTDGLDRFREYAVPTISRNQGFSNSLSSSVQATPDGSIWVGTPDGLNRWAKGHITVYRGRSALSKNRQAGGTKLNVSEAAAEITNSGFAGTPLSLGLDDAGRLWVSTGEGVFYFEHNRFVRAPGIPGYALSIVGDGHGMVWTLHNTEGVFYWSHNGPTQQIPWSRFAQKIPRTMLPDREVGTLWLGFFNGGLVYLKNGNLVRSFGAADKLDGRVNHLRFGPNGELWASNENGFSRIKDWQVATLTQKNGLPCDEVHWSMEDEDHTAWLHMPCGLVRIARSELDAWIEDPMHILKTTVFDNSDGVRSVGIYGNYGPRVTKSPDGKIWFVPGDGVSVIDPRHLPFNKLPPPVHVEQITADGKTYDASNGLSLPAHVRDLSIDYTALSFVAPEKIRFRYKLEGQDPSWREVVNDRRAQYSNLPPRRYTFRVMACNNGGVWNEAGATLDFVIPPAWYQTNWFRAACVVAFLSMLWGIYELRVRQLAAQFNLRLDERVNERTRIARELHDTLLQNFQGLLPRFQAALYMLPERVTEARKTLEAAVDKASEAITEGRDAVKGLRLSTVEKNDLAVAVRTLGEELAAASANQSSPTFEVAVLGTPRSLHPILRDEVYRLVAEALRNAFGHAQARKIEVEVRYGEREFRLQVRDNGKGIDPSLLSGDGREGHYGLHGMNERAKIVGGKLKVWSELDSGTEVELSIPAMRAYTQPPRRLRLLQKLSRKDKDRQEKVEL